MCKTNVCTTNVCTTTHYNKPRVELTLTVWEAEVSLFTLVTVLAGVASNTGTLAPVHLTHTVQGPVIETLTRITARVTIVTRAAAVEN